MGSLNALNARPHDDGFLNPCRRTSKVFCKTHLGLRKEHAAPAKKKKKSEGVKARPPRRSHHGGGLQEKPWPAFRPWFTAK